MYCYQGIDRVQGPIELPPIIIKADRVQTYGSGLGGGYDANSTSSPYGNASKSRQKFFNGAGTGAGWHDDFDYDEVIPSNIGMLGKLNYPVAAQNSLELIEREHQRQRREYPGLVQADINATVAANTASGLSPAQITAFVQTTSRSSKGYRAMTFEIIGFASGQDNLQYQKDIPLSCDELTIIMEWKEEDDWVHDWSLTVQQLIEIQKRCPFELPKDLDLYLSCHQ